MKLLSPKDDPGSSLPGGKQRKGKHQRSYIDTDAKSLTSAAGWRRGISLSPSGPDCPQDGTEAGEIPVHHLPAVLSVLRCSICEVQQDLQASCMQPGTSNRLFFSWMHAVKEDLLVWCVKNPLFRTRQQPSANPWIGTLTGASATHSGATSGSHHHVEQANHTPSDEEVCRGSTLETASREQNVPSPSSMCWITGCGVEHPAKTCPHTTLGTI